MNLDPTLFLRECLKSVFVGWAQRIRNASAQTSYTNFVVAPHCVVQPTATVTVVINTVAYNLHPCGGREPTLPSTNLMRVQSLFRGNKLRLFYA
jgi:hypothetical protein